MRFFFVLSAFFSILDAQTPWELIESARTEIQQGNYEDAERNLKQALLLEPESSAAKNQLGLLYLHQGNLDGAYDIFAEVLNTDPCNKDAIEGFREIGGRWGQVESKQQEAAAIYAQINVCEPQNPDTLFYLGRALARTKQYEEAEEKLKECLEIAPQYGDAAVQLGYVYLWQERYAEAEEKFEKVHGNRDAKMGLALAKNRQGKSQEAKQLFDEVLAEDPKKKDALRERGRIYSSNLDYFAAEPDFQAIVNDDPNNENLWAELFDIGSHTRYALFVETLYTDSKENDPTLKVPVVKDYYFYNAAHLLVPIANRWRLDFKQIYYHQRENDIYPPVGVNYSMYLSGGQATSSYFFTKNWRWDLAARSYYAWGWQDVNYPFHNTTRFEPGTSLIYNDGRLIFSLDAHVEALVIKNFSNFTSLLMRTDFLTGGLLYKFDTILKPEAEAWVNHIFIHDNLHNWENTELAIARVGVPFLTDYVTGIYRFEHGHFDKLNPNYYSFKQQFRNVIGVRLHIPFMKNFYWDTYYFHRWQTTYNLFQPIGNFIFVAAKQYLAANWVTSGINYRFRDKIKLVLEGRYFHDTLPYRDWNITGSFLWQF